jgi:uncharacterized membrane protein
VRHSRRDTSTAIHCRFVYRPEGCEFYVTLGLQGSGPECTRLELVQLNAWSLLVATSTWTNYFSALTGSDPAGQLEVLRRDPLIVAHVAPATLTKYWQTYADSFIGVLGWLDTPLPRSYCLVAAWMLGIAVGTAILGARGHRVAPAGAVGIVAGVMLSILGVFISQYLTWSPPGSETVQGIQGRYFIPLALVCVTLLHALGSIRTARVHRLLTILILTFPLVSLAVVMRAIVLRYYLG